MRRELILSIAFKKFAEKGYNASLSEIAKDSGIRKQTLYNYFESKNDLFFEIIRLETTEYFNKKQQEYETFGSLNAELRLKMMFLSTMKYFEDRQKLWFWRWIILIDSEELRKKSREIIREREKIFFGILDKTFLEGMENGEIKKQPIQALIHTYIALTQGTLDGILLYDKVIDADPFINNVWDTFCNGIKIS